MPGRHKGAGVHRTGTPQIRALPGPLRAPGEAFPQLVQVHYRCRGEGAASIHCTRFTSPPYHQQRHPYRGASRSGTDNCRIQVSCMPFHAFLLTQRGMFDYKKYLGCFVDFSARWLQAGITSFLQPSLPDTSSWRDSAHICGLQEVIVAECTHPVVGRMEQQAVCDDIDG